MDILSLYYFSELAKDLHMTRTASRLYLSQQTLSNHIQRLEEYYGVQLLRRKPTLALTCAGEVVLAFAELMTREQTNLKSRLSDLAQETGGIIRFGASHLRTGASLPQILSAFSAQYPQVEIRLTNANSAQLEPKVLDGSLDFAVILAQTEDIDPKLANRHLMDDQLYQYYGAKTDTLKQAACAGASVADFSRLPFCTAANRVGTLLQRCFEEAQIAPNIYLSDPDFSVSTTVCFQGLAACILTKTGLITQKSAIPQKLNIFPLLYQGKPIVQSLYLVYRKDRYQPRYADCFCRLLVEQFQKLHQTTMEQIVSYQEVPSYVL